MAWLTRLYETYENLSASPELMKACGTPLVPVSHTVQTAHIEVVLSADGEFIRAECIPPDDALTIVPCTEDSAVRSSGIAPHMLFDNLKYVAGDAVEYNADPKTVKNYEAYCSQLSEWCGSEGCPEFARSVYKYVSKGRLIQDLIGQGILNFEDDKLKWNGNADSKPSGDIFSAFIRFDVRGAEDIDDVMKAYTAYDAGKYTDIKMCFVTGKKVSVTYKHPSKIRYSGDSAKLISANDKSGFTFRGRVNKPEEAVAVGYDVSQKAHSALRWLIANQGFKTGEQTVIVWSPAADKIPDIMADTFDLFGQDECEKENAYTPLDTYAKKVEKALNGYGCKLDVDPDRKVVIMIIEAATPGRMSISYYKEFGEYEYIDNIKKWHTSCIWDHSYRYIKKEADQETGKKKEKREYIKYTGAPSINDIILSLYGMNVDNKFKKQMIEMLISCVAEGRKLPYELVRTGVWRVSNPSGMEEWDIAKSTSIVCALIRKYYYDKGETIDMALDRENNDRSYLFGRVLAYAERIEEYANYLSDEKRVTNARRLRDKFRVQPTKTLLQIEKKLEPYVERLIKMGKTYLYDEFLATIARINENDFTDGSPLSPKYLLGYAAQMSEFKQKKDSEDVSEENTDINN